MAVADVSAKPLAELISLQGRGAVVTGAAQGLGKAIASRLAEAGASVMILDLDEEKASRAAAELAQGSSGRIASREVDVTDSAAIKAAADAAVDLFGSLDVWVNNAGLYPNVGVMEMTDETWDHVSWPSTLRGVLAGAREAARHMIGRRPRRRHRQHRFDRRVSEACAPGVTAYVASKHGVRGRDEAARRSNSHRTTSASSAWLPTFCTHRRQHCGGSPQSCPATRPLRRSLRR